jgi:hypothetical protein
MNAASRCCLIRSRWLLCLALVLGGCAPASHDKLPQLSFAALEQEVNKGNVIRIRFEESHTIAECHQIPEVARHAGAHATMFQVALPAEAGARNAFIRTCAKQGVSMMKYH